MSCTDLLTWYLRHHVAVLDIRSAEFRRAWGEVVPSGYTVSTCLHRLVAGGRLRRIARGIYLVVDTVRETPVAAIASGVFSQVPHYLTTDGALAQHGLLDQPVTTLTVVLSHMRRPIQLDFVTVIRPVTLDERRLSTADAYGSTVEGFAVRLASREQAVLDALAEPHWMVYGDLLPEILRAFSDDELARTATGALGRTVAAAQRLGYLLEEAGRLAPPALAELRPVRAVRLRPQKPTRGPYSSRWRVYG